MLQANYWQLTKQATLIFSPQIAPTKAIKGFFFKPRVRTRYLNILTKHLCTQLWILERLNHKRRSFVASTPGPFLQPCLWDMPWDITEIYLAFLCQPFQLSFSKSLKKRDNDLLCAKTMHFLGIWDQFQGQQAQPLWVFLSHHSIPPFGNSDLRLKATENTIQNLILWSLFLL